MTAPRPADVPSYLARQDLDGRRVVVMGAGQGIGRQVTHALAQCGATVMGVDVDAERARQVADETSARPWVGDVTVRADMERLMADAVRLLGGIDAVVDIVGMARFGAVTSADDPSWLWHYEVVLHHAVMAVQLASPVMAANGGGVFAFVASISGIGGAPQHAAYGAMKAGLTSFVRSAAAELGPSGIRVNAVAPGIVGTPRMKETLGESAWKALSEYLPLRRVADPDDIASVLLFLVSDLSRYVTGQTILCDGGATAMSLLPLQV